MAGCKGKGRALRFWCLLQDAPVGAASNAGPTHGYVTWIQKRCDFASVVANSTKIKSATYVQAQPAETRAPKLINRFFLAFFWRLFRRRWFMLRFSHGDGLGKNGVPIPLSLMHQSRSQSGGSDPVQACTSLLHTHIHPEVCVCVRTSS